MSKLPLSICNYPGCSNRVPKGYCATHKGYRLNPHLDKIYRSREWREASLEYRRNNPLCVLCYKEGRVVAAHSVDHINPVVEGGDFWDKSNWQSLCKSHHSKKTRKELNERR